MKQYNKNTKQTNINKFTYNYSCSLTEENSIKHNPNNHNLYDTSIFKDSKYSNANILDRNITFQSKIFTTNPSSCNPSIFNSYRSPNSSNIYLTQMEENSKIGKSARCNFIHFKNNHSENKSKKKFSIIRLILRYPHTINSVFHFLKFFVILYSFGLSFTFWLLYEKNKNNLKNYSFNIDL